MLTTYQYTPGYAMPRRTEIIDPRAAAPLPRAQLVALVTDGCDSPHTRRNYSAAVNDFMDWYEAAGHPLLNKATISAYKRHLQETVSARTGRPLSASAKNLRLIAVRKLLGELADNGVIAPEVATSAAKVKGIAQRGLKMGRWLPQAQAQALLDAQGSGALVARKTKRAHTNDCGHRPRLLVSAPVLRDLPDTARLGHIPSGFSQTLADRPTLRLRRLCP